MCSRPSDLTAKARIRNAAVEHFARDGYEKANLRAIAATAGVTSGLVIHYFGSKEGLRNVCDGFVLETLVRRTRDDAHPSGMQAVYAEYQANPEEYVLQVQYMVRAVHDDAPAAATFVDTLVDEAEAALRTGAADGTMRASSDPRALAVLSVLTSLATLTMAPPFARALGFERFGPDLLERLAVPTLELYTYGLYTDDAALKIAQGET